MIRNKQEYQEALDRLYELEKDLNDRRVASEYWYLAEQVRNYEDTINDD